MLTILVFLFSFPCQYTHIDVCSYSTYFIISVWWSYCENTSVTESSQVYAIHVLRIIFADKTLQQCLNNRSIEASGQWPRTMSNIYCIERVIKETPRFLLFARFSQSRSLWESCFKAFRKIIPYFLERSQCWELKRDVLLFKMNDFS